MVQTTQLELFINGMLQGLKYKSMLKLLGIPELCNMIQRLNSYNLLTDKVAEKVH